MRRNAMYRRNHLVAVRNGKRAAGTKIVLHVDDNQNIVRIDLHA